MELRIHFMESRIQDTKSRIQDMESRNQDSTQNTGYLLFNHIGLSMSEL